MLFCRAARELQTVDPRTGQAETHSFTVRIPPGASEGRRIRVPGHTTNMGWGDADWRTLYITTYTSVFRLRLNIPGIPVRPS